MIYITIPVHNRKELLKECLISLEKQTNKNFQIIVTDDGSTDGTSEMLNDRFPEVITIQGNGNLWWTGAINKAVEHAMLLSEENDYLLILNDDLIVPEDYIENFYKLAAKHKDTLIGSVVTDINQPDKIHSGGIKINWLTAKVHGINHGKSLSAFSKGYYTEVSYLTGRGVLIPRKVFKTLGLYNNDHYKQCGDTELPCRAKKAGYKLIVSYDVAVFSHVKDEGHINHLRKFSIANLKKYYFDIRSNMNLRYRFWFAFDATPNVILGAWFFTLDFIRITGHFIKKLRMN